MAATRPGELLLLVAERDALPPSLERELALLGRRIARIEPHVLAEQGLEGTVASEAVAVAARRRHLVSLQTSLERLRRLPGAPDVVVALLPLARDDAEPLHLLADDFAIFPASGAEIALRLRIVRLRRQRQRADSGPTPLLRIDREAFTVAVDGRRIDLTFTEFELLCALEERRGRVVPREALARAVWGHDRLNGSRVVDVHLWRLRTKLEADGGRLIETVRNRGYRLL